MLDILRYIKERVKRIEWKAQSEKIEWKVLKGIIEEKE